MSWKVSRYQQTNNLLEPTLMTVIIDNGVDRIQKDLDGDHREDTDDALIRQVLDKFYEQHFPNRAENEKFHIVDSKILEMNAKLTEMDTEVAEATNIFKAELESVKALFVKSSDLTDEDKETLVSQFDEYQIGVAYEVGKILNVDGILYRVIQAHTSQEDWDPTSTASLYTPYLTPTIVDEDGTETEVVNEFKQPTGAHDAYQKGDKILFKGEVYESLIDNNAYSPEAYAQGWKKIEA